MRQLGGCTVPDPHVALMRHVSQDSPTMSRAFSISRRILSTPGALPVRSFLTTAKTSVSNRTETRILFDLLDIQLLHPAGNTENGLRSYSVQRFISLHSTIEIV